MRFESLADEGRALLEAARYDQAAAVLRTADELWRGEALSGFADRGFAQGLAARLEERRLAAAEDRIQAELALGRHTAVIGRLAESVAAHPLRERLREQYALALYRAGRQADALRTLEEGRAQLRDELGVDPGPGLRALLQAVLAQDPALDVVAAPSATPSASTPADPAPVAPSPAPSAPTAPVATAPTAAVTAAAGPGTGTGTGEPLIGRDSELGVLRAAFDETAAGTRVVIIEGEPGIGKTRLVEELAAEAGARGAQVLWGRAFEGGAAPALWPWLAPLRTLADALPAGESISVELAQALAPSGRSHDGRVSGEDSRFVLFDGVVELLGAATRRRPVVLVVDDAQWADPASLELLTLAAGRLADARLLVVCTVRELEIGRNDDLVAALATLTRHPATRRLRLRGLPRSATAELVARASGRPVDDALVAAIHERAEGNPFFATELARLLADDPGVGTRQRLHDVPTGVRDVVRRRLAQLPADTQELLQVGAVIGREVDLGLLARASGRPLDDCLDALDPAVVHRLLVEVEHPPGTYRFAHALVREVVVDDVSSLRRARLHLRVADALDPGDDRAEILAEHLWAAVPIGAGRRAADALERAADVATRRLAYGSAVRLLDRALELRRSLGSSPQDRVEELRALASLVSATAAHRGYASLIDSSLLARGKELAADTGNAAELLNLLWAEWAGLDVGCRFARADPIADELLRRSSDSDDPVAAVLGHTAYGIACWHRGDMLGAGEHLGQARATALALGPTAGRGLLVDLDQLRLSIPFAVYIRDLQGELDDPEAAYDQTVAEIPGSHRFWELLVMNFAASGALSVGDYPRAARAAKRGLAADPDGVFAFWHVALKAYWAAADTLGGDLDDGLRRLRAAWQEYTAMDVRTNGTLWLAAGVEALARAGRVEEAAAALDDARQVFLADGERYAEPALLQATAAVAWAGGDTDAAVAAFREALSITDRCGSRGVQRRVRAVAAALGVDLETVPAEPA